MPDKQLSIAILLLLLFFSKAYSQADTLKPQTDSFSQIREIFLTDANEGRLDSALYYGKLLEQLAIRIAGDKSEELAGVLYYMGEVHRMKENYREAYYIFKKSVSIFDELDTVRVIPALYAYATDRVGFMCDMLGAAEEEEVYFKKAIAIKKKYLHTHDIDIANNAQTYLMLANLHMHKGEYEKADSIYYSISALLDTLPANSYNLYIQASVYGNEAAIYSQTGNIFKAIQYLKKSIPLEIAAKASGYPVNELIVLFLNLAEAYSMNKQMDSAWKYVTLAEDSLTTTGNQKSYLRSEVIKNKAFVFQQEKKDKEAIQLLKQYLIIVDTLPQVVNDYYATLVNLGVLYSETNNLASADSLYKNIIAKLQDSGLLYTYAFLEANRYLCSNLITEKKWDEATDSLLSLLQLTYKAITTSSAGMSESEKLQYEANGDKIFDMMYWCLHNNASIPQKTITPVYKAELQRKGWVLRNQLAQLSTIRSSKDSILISLYEQWLNSKEMLAHQYSLPYNQRFFNLDSLQEATDDLEKKIAVKSASAISNEDALPSSLQPGVATANIQFVRYSNEPVKEGNDRAWYAAFITTPADTLPRFIDLCNEKELISLLTEKSGKWINENQLTKILYDKNSASTIKLYNCIWKRLEPYLIGIKKINYSTASLLNNISFPAIYNGKNYLINRFTFNRFFDLQESFASSTSSTTPQHVSIWGNINYNTANYAGVYANAALKSKPVNSVSSFTPFVSSEKGISNKPLLSFDTVEIANIKKTFSNKNVIVQSVESADATEDSFKQQAASLSGILHISTHGFYVALNDADVKSAMPVHFISSGINPLFRCGLAFAGANDYWMTGSVKTNCDDGILNGYEVSQLDLHNIDLVTLSACETGLGDITNNEGNLGLQRAFKIAGVHNMLVSLWQVPARQTAELLSLFYKGLLTGNPYSEALRTAELTLQKEYPPYYWAGFVLIQ